jgi:hypothetical protein
VSDLPQAQPDEQVFCIVAVEHLPLRTSLNLFIPLSKHPYKAGFISFEIAKPGECFTPRLSVWFVLISLGALHSHWANPVRELEMVEEALHSAHWTQAMTGRCFFGPL